MEPERIGRYRVLRLLGQGGMGAVYEALQEPIQRRVALKLLLPEYGQNQEVLQRFFNEAHAVNLIEHPSLVQISDYGQTEDGTAYLVMEYLRGETISARLNRLHQRGVRLPLAQTLQVATQLANALTAAHDKSVIHRDLKPANVMMVPDPAVPGGERAKLLDFGIAKLAQGIGQGTATCTIMGTPQYMSPEQCKGTGSVDRKTDVYALGVMLFEMLSGRLPFHAESAFDYMGQHVFQPPPPLRELAPDAPAQIVDLVHRMLSKDKAERPTMRELGTALATISSTLPMGSSLVLPLRERGLSGTLVLSQTLTPSSLHASSGESQRPPTIFTRRKKGLMSLSAGVGGLLVILGLRPLLHPHKTASTTSSATVEPSERLNAAGLISLPSLADSSAPLAGSRHTPPSHPSQMVTKMNQASPVTVPSKPAKTIPTKDFFAKVGATSSAPAQSLKPRKGMAESSNPSAISFDSIDKKLNRKRRTPANSQSVGSPPSNRRTDDYEQ